MYFHRIQKRKRVFLWFGEGITYVAENNKILGMYKLIKNQRDLGSMWPMPPLWFLRSSR